MTTKTAATEKAFGEIFSSVVRCFQPRPLQPGTQQAYATALERFPLDVLREAADRLTRSRKYFPTVQEWASEASVVQLAHRSSAATCAECGDRGIVRIDYQSGQPFDLAICRCDAARVYRRGGPALVRLRFQLDDTHDVWLLEDLDDACDTKGGTA